MLHKGASAPSAAAGEPLPGGRAAGRGGAAVAPEPPAASRPPDRVQYADSYLWLVAKEGKVEEVRAALENGAKPEWEMEMDENSVEYKGRRLCCRALHAAAAFSDGDNRGKAEGSEKAAQVIKLLLEHRADVHCYARVVAARAGARDLREMQAIHIAAGTGNVAAIRYLLDHHADVNAAAKIDGKLHYMPIHDAAWQNRVDSVKYLLEQTAKVEATNHHGNTALHLAAQLGHVDIVRFLVDVRVHSNALQHRGVDGQPVIQAAQKWWAKAAVRPAVGHVAKEAVQQLLRKKNHAGKTPLDVAVEHGRFSPKELHLFTLWLDGPGQVDAFVTVAHACPAAASALLRSGDTATDAFEEDMGMCPIQEEWKRSLQDGAEAGRISVATLTSLMRFAPASAIDLLDALTDAPQVRNNEHHPLPLRAKLQGSAVSGYISYAYEKDVIWEWSPAEPHHNGGRPWHSRLAPPDMRNGREVKVRVVRLPGILDLGFLHALAAATDIQVFSKVTVHALLEFAWGRLWPVFMLDFLHEAFAAAVISCWSWAVQPAEAVRCAMWCMVASCGLRECILHVLVGYYCLTHLGVWQTLAWFGRVWVRLGIQVCTVVLAARTNEMYWPEDPDKVILAVNVMMHWMLLLYELRAFQWIGRRLLPIIKSFQPITGMLVVMAFMVSGITHAFWAINAAADADSFFQIAVLLFVGDGFGDMLDAQDPGDRDRLFYIALMLFAMFIFTVCTTNVFIAVLGDCYDQEQDRMVCTFMNTRATICSDLLMRPLWRSQAFIRLAGKLKQVARAFLLLFLLGLGVAAAAVVLRLGVQAWLLSLILAAWIQFAQAVVHGSVTHGWQQRYLWFCHDAHMEEPIFMATVDARDLAENHGRISRIKRHIAQQTRHINNTLTARMDEQDKKVTKRLRRVEEELNRHRECQTRIDKHLAWLIDRFKSFECRRSTTPTSHSKERVTEALPVADKEPSRPPTASQPAASPSTLRAAAAADQPVPAVGVPGAPEAMALAIEPAA